MTPEIISSNFGYDTIGNAIFLYLEISTLFIHMYGITLYSA